MHPPDCPYTEGHDDFLRVRDVVAVPPLHPAGDGLRSPGAAFLATTKQTKLYTASSLIRVQQRVTSANDIYGALQQASGSPARMRR